jgi:gamma-glutamylcyclotransferase (GGCT)/AIG2-like uncharacterized protein YtfP
VTVVYFAYGANMDPIHMAERCPAAARLGLAALPGHRFAIAAGGYGMTRRVPGSTVHGVLWRLTPADEAALDEFEGVAAGFYRKTDATVRDPSGTPVSAMVYVPADSAPGRPAPGYLERIVEVATALGFPAEYVAALEAQLAPDVTARPE